MEEQAFFPLGNSRSMLSAGEFETAAASVNSLAFAQSGRGERETDAFPSWQTSCEDAMVSAGK
ncbi:MAG: hypothetical protein LBP78_02755 [Acidaminococcales bacterium]|jgi:hypothetical protein|nr:hypothetical protein [Acidaminococcales bacterium]